MARNDERRRIDFNALAAGLGRASPRPVLTRALRAALGGQSLALCLHRVRDTPRATDWQPGLGLSAAALDALLERLLAAQPGRDERWLTVTFDDGYADATRYVAERAPRFPTVDFICFVCPEKVSLRAGFRWDLVEEAVRAGRPMEEARRLLDEPFTLTTENQRPELRALGDHPDFRLSTVEELQAVARLPNVSVGNHTNLHAVASKLPLADFTAEMGRAQHDFERLFGPVRHFAFPFGTPGHQFDARHVAALRALGDFTIWSTEARTFSPRERGPGAVLPRFPVDGTQSLDELTGWLLARTVRARLTGSRHSFPA